MIQYEAMRLLLLLVVMVVVVVVVVVLLLVVVLVAAVVVVLLLYPLPQKHIKKNVRTHECSDQTTRTRT